MGIINFLTGGMFGKKKGDKNSRKIEKQLNDAISYFEAHKIDVTLDGLRQFTGLDEYTIRDFYEFNSDGMLQYE